MFWLGCRKLRRFPVVWTAHNISTHDAPNAAYDRRMLQQLVQRCDGIVALSQATADALQRAFDVPHTTRVVVAPHGHYIDAYENKITQIEARNKLNIPQHARVIVFFGRVRPYKGVEDLIAAFSDVDNKNSVLLIAGDAHPRNVAEELMGMVASHPRSKDIRLHLQEVADEDVQTYLNACDVVALPFREVLNSGSLLLALSFGRCVVGPTTGALSEMTPPLAWFGYDPQQNNGLTQALNCALAEEHLDRRGLEAKTWVKRNYGWDRFGNVVFSLYKEIVSAR